MRDTPNRILEFLTAPPPARRRRLPVEPSPTLRRPVELAWPEGKSWRAARAKLRDISRGGAALVARGAPPSSGPARLRIVDGEGTPWVEVKLLGSEPDGAKHRVRLRFVDPCPSYMLRLAVLGTAEPDDDAPARFRGRVTWHTGFTP